MNQHFTLAIDGPSGAGKSTIARAIAGRTQALYLDTGAMYRAVGLAALRQGIDMSDDGAIARLCATLVIDVKHREGVQRMFLYGEDVTDAIRHPRVSAAASRVSAVPAVRERLVAMQREIARGRSVVMDGRDIGTKVLPGATLKVFLVADIAERARRRHRELAAKGLPDSYEQVYASILRRDHDDQSRAASPLKPARDAVELDTTHLSLEETVDQILRLLLERLAKPV